MKAYFSLVHGQYPALGLGRENVNRVNSTRNSSWRHQPYEPCFSASQTTITTEELAHRTFSDTPNLHSFSNHKRVIRSVRSTNRNSLRRIPVRSQPMTFVAAPATNHFGNHDRPTATRPIAVTHGSSLRHGKLANDVRERATLNLNEKLVSMIQKGDFEEILKTYFVKGKNEMDIFEEVESTLQNSKYRFDFYALWMQHRSSMPLNSSFVDVGFMTVLIHYYSFNNVIGSFDVSMFLYREINNRGLKLDFCTHIKLHRIACKQGDTSTVEELAAFLFADEKPLMRWKLLESYQHQINHYVHHGIAQKGLEYLHKLCFSLNAQRTIDGYIESEGEAPLLCAEKFFFGATCLFVQHFLGSRCIVEFDLRLKTSQAENTLKELVHFFEPLHTILEFVEKDKSAEFSIYSIKSTNCKQLW